MSNEVDRRSFLNLSATSLAGMALSEAGFSQTASSGKAVRLAFVGVGNRGSYHLDCALGIEGVEVAAVCDVDDKALYRAKRWVERAGQPSPRLYGESKTAYKALCEKETVDCVICCTPWEYHAAVCIAATKNGKNAVSEVPIIQTMQEAWELVEIHESTKKWATMGLEGFGDLTLMNMVRKGLLGDVLHAEGGYVHDLRMVKFNPLEEPWRLQHSVSRHGKLYPDHPLAPILRLLDIKHRDRFDSIVSMSTKAVMLNRYAAQKFGEKHPYATQKMAQGDVNVSLIHTAEGKMVTLNFDTETPHPRELFRLQGTKGVFLSGASLPRTATPPQSGAQPAARAAAQYGRRGGMIYLDGRSPVEDQWESAESYYDEYQHPFMKSYKPTQRKE